MAQSWRSRGSEALEGDLGEGFGGGEEGKALAGGGLEFVEGAELVVEGNSSK